MPKVKTHWLVFYSENCSPKIAAFPSEKEARVFVKLFKLQHLSNKNDNWVDLIVVGDVYKLYEGATSLTIQYYI